MIKDLWSKIQANLPDGTKDWLREAVPAALRSVELKVPERAVNAVLGAWVKSGAKSAEGIDALQLRVGDGYLEIVATGKRLVRLHVTMRFTVISCEISLRKQELHLKRIGAPDLTAETWYERLILGVGVAIFSVLFDRSPVDRLLEQSLGITVNGDEYVVTLNKPGFADIVRDTGSVRNVLDLFEIHSLVCKPETLVLKARPKETALG